MSSFFISFSLPFTGFSSKVLGVCQVRLRFPGSGAFVGVVGGKFPAERLVRLAALGGIRVGGWVIAMGAGEGGLGLGMR